MKKKKKINKIKLEKLRNNISAPSKILLVDDDQIFRKEFKDCFEGYEILEASNADEALSILKRPNEIDLVISDLRMRGISGVELLGKVKEIAPSVRTVLITGYGSKEVVVDALRGKADDYIEKPMDIEATKQIIEKLLDSKIRTGNGEACDVKGKIARALYYIERNCLKKVSLKDVAGSVYLSPKYLSRIFKEYTGKSFNNYRLSLKINQAKKFLSGSGFNIDQISNKLGYQNAESFIRRFKKITGFTPTEFRIKSSRKKK